MINQGKFSPFSSCCGCPIVQYHVTIWHAKWAAARAEGHPASCLRRVPEGRNWVHVRFVGVLLGLGGTTKGRRAVERNVHGWGDWGCERKVDLQQFWDVGMNKGVVAGGVQPCLGWQQCFSLFSPLSLLLRRILSEPPFRTWALFECCYSSTAFDTVQWVAFMHSTGNFNTNWSLLKHLSF